MSRVRDLADLLLRNSPESMGAVKKLLASFAKERLDRDLTRAMRWNEKIRNSRDFREGLSAFLEKRDPVWPAQAEIESQLFRQKLRQRISMYSLSGYHLRVCQTKFVGEF